MLTICTPSEKPKRYKTSIFKDRHRLRKQHLFFFFFPFPTLHPHLFKILFSQPCYPHTEHCSIIFRHCWKVSYPTSWHCGLYPYTSGHSFSCSTHCQICHNLQIHSLLTTATETPVKTLGSLHSSMQPNLKGWSNSHLVFEINPYCLFCSFMSYPLHIQV